MKRLLIILLIPFSLFSQIGIDSTKVRLELDSISKKQIEYLCTGNMKYVDLFSKNYIDLGGGPSGDGKVDFEDLRKNYKRFFQSEKFKKMYLERPIRELLDVDNLEILNYSSILKVYGDVSKFFVLKEGDYFVRYQPIENSPLSDGWFAIFRVQNETWKVVAGD